MRELAVVFRCLRRSPASSVAAVVTLAVTLAAGTSILATVNAIRTPPPFTDPSALVTLGEAPLETRATAPRAVGWATFVAWRTRVGTGVALEAFDGTNLTFTGEGPSERLRATNVTPGFFALLGVHAARGRTFDADDFGQRVTLVSHAFWRTKLAADPEVIGRRIVLGGETHAIIGVLPESFMFELSGSDVWRPFPIAASNMASSGYRVTGIGRLVHGRSIASLVTALDHVSRTSAQPSRVVITPVSAAIAGDAPRLINVLAAAAGLALVLAFTNLAFLLTVRTIDRRKELAVKAALGARPSDVLRSLLLESQMLVVIGAAAGIVLALWITPLVGQLALAQFTTLANRHVSIDWRTLGLALGAAFACGCLSVVWPSYVAVHASSADRLRRGMTSSSGERRIRRAFVAGEVAMAFVLLSALAVLGRGLLSTRERSPGFDANGLVTMQVSLPSAAYPSDRVRAFYDTLHDALDRRLGSESVSFVDELPLTGDRGRVLVAAGPTETSREAVVRSAGRGYFNVMRIPVVTGREFARDDTPSAPLRVVVSESLATALFGHDASIGRQVQVGEPQRPAEIIGVVGDVAHRALNDPPTPTIYFSASQTPSNGSVLVVRTNGGEAHATTVVREEAARLDPALPIYNVRSMRVVLDASPGVPVQRVLTSAFLGFAMLAVVLAAIGLFAVMAQDVASRERELALRMALGARRARILGATMGEGAGVILAGLLIGVLPALGAIQLLGGLGLTGSLNSLGAVVAAGALALVGACAVLPSALRAMRADPMMVLRGE